MSKSQNVFEKAKLAVTASLNVTKIGSVVSVIGIAAAYGMCVWVTIVSKYLLTSVLGRHRLVVAQSKDTSSADAGRFLPMRWRCGRPLTSCPSIFMVEANASFVEPRAIKAMIERIKVEKEEGRGLDILESHSCEGESLTCGKKVIDKMDEDAVNRRLKKLNESHRLSLTY
ncbi:Late embryogenesis abundant protein (LEA) family protein [Raphanus sativus]|nr:Late embryogenesis abundant protein (LEA) family protein [Raphanus sativus]